MKITFVCPINKPERARVFTLTLKKLIKTKLINNKIESKITF